MSEKNSEVVSPSNARDAFRAFLDQDKKVKSKKKLAKEKPEIVAAPGGNRDSLCAFLTQDKVAWEEKKKRKKKDRKSPIDAEGNIRRRNSTTTSSKPGKTSSRKDAAGKSRRTSL